MTTPHPCDMLDVPVSRAFFLCAFLRDEHKNPLPSSIGSQGGKGRFPVADVGCPGTLLKRWNWPWPFRRFLLPGGKFKRRCRESTKTSATPLSVWSSTSTAPSAESTLCTPKPSNELSLKERRVQECLN